MNCAVTRTVTPADPWVTLDWTQFGGSDDLDRSGPLVLGGGRGLLVSLVASYGRTILTGVDHHYR